MRGRIKGAILQELPESIDIGNTVFQNRGVDIAARKLTTILRVAPTGRFDLKNQRAIGVRELFSYSLAMVANRFKAVRASHPYVDLPGALTLVSQVDPPIQSS